MMTITTQPVLGYEEELKEVDGEYDYQSRSYVFSPIHEPKRGTITTAAVKLCRECRGVISSMGGGGNRYICPKCYQMLKLADFAQGHEHEILELKND